MLNNIDLQGRLVANPELKFTPNGAAVTTFTIAVERSYVKSGSERKTDFIDIVAWEKTAELICTHFQKGQLIIVSGSLQTRAYNDKSGHNRKAYEVNASAINFCGSKPNKTEPDTAHMNNSDNGSIETTAYTDDEDLPF